MSYEFGDAVGGTVEVIVLKADGRVRDVVGGVPIGVHYLGVPHAIHAVPIVVAWADVVRSALPGESGPRSGEKAHHR